MKPRAQPSSLSRWLIAVGLAVALLVPASAGAEFAQPGAIEGRVTAGPKKAPVEGVEICANASVEGENFTQCETSKSDGSYEVIGLPEAIYRVSFASGESGPLVVTEYWKNVTKPAAATLLHVHESQTIEGIDAQLQLASGTVGAAAPGGHHKHRRHKHRKHHHKHGR